MKIRKAVFDLVVNTMEEYRVRYESMAEDYVDMKNEAQQMHNRLCALDNNVVDKTKDNRISELEDENYELRGELRKYARSGD